jgi:hypothetical protein
MVFCLKAGLRSGSESRIQPLSRRSPRRSEWTMTLPCGLSIGMLSIAAAISGVPPLSLELKTGKSSYVRNEPIYFEIIVTNNSDEFVPYAEPVAIGMGTFGFCLGNGCVPDRRSLGSLSDYMVTPVLAPKTGYRATGALDFPTQVKLLEGKQGRIGIYARMKWQGKAGIRWIQSSVAEIQIRPETAEDSALLADLKKLGAISWVDNASGQAFFTSSTLSLSTSGKNAPDPDKFLAILEKYRQSAYYPYVVAAYFANIPPYVPDPASKEYRACSYWERALREEDARFKSADPIFYGRLLSRLSSFEGKRKNAKEIAGRETDYREKLSKYAKDNDVFGKGRDVIDFELLNAVYPGRISPQDRAGGRIPDDLREEMKGQGK